MKKIMVIIGLIGLTTGVAIAGPPVPGTTGDGAACTTGDYYESRTVWVGWCTCEQGGRWVTHGCLTVCTYQTEGSYWDCTR
jgi:hypothetical protein